MHGPRPIGPSRATRAIIALVAAVACLGGVAYAATRCDLSERDAGGGKPDRKRGQRPARPRFLEDPPPQQPGRGGPGPGPAPAPETAWRRFQCRFEGGDWEGCSSPRRLAELEPGDHEFAVRALNRRGLPGPAAHYSWAQVESK